jgi:hypothetical protein
MNLAYTFRTGKELRLAQSMIGTLPLFLNQHSTIVLFPAREVEFWEAALH